MVGAAGFEPATARTPSVCATRLRYAPIFIIKTLRVIGTAAKNANCPDAAAPVEVTALRLPLRASATGGKTRI